MKKALLIIITLALMLSLFAGCGEAAAPDCTLSELLAELISENGIENEIDLSAAELLDYYGIKGEDIKQSAACITMNGIFPDEIIMVEAANDEAAGRVKACLESRLQEVLNQSKNYDAESYAVAQTCKVEARGSFIALFVSAKHEAMTEQYGAHFK